MVCEQCRHRRFAVAGNAVKSQASSRKVEHRNMQTLSDVKNPLRSIVGVRLWVKNYTTECLEVLRKQI